MIILTIDTDWAPDWATAAVLEKVRSLGIKVTVFFSTPSPVELWPQLEQGCHPDLSRRQPLDCERQYPPLAPAGHRHDLAVEEAEADILAYYRAAFPLAGALRTHRFYWHSDLSRLLSRQGFSHDSSLILPFQPHLKGFKVGRLRRWPVWSSDHLHLARGLPLDRLDMPNWKEPGLKIFCFHVAYLYLNASSLSEFNMIHQGLEQAGSTAAIGGRRGVWNLFEELSGELARRGPGHWLSELDESWLTDGLHH